MIMKTRIGFIGLVFCVAGVINTSRTFGQGDGYITSSAIKANGEPVNREVTFGDEIYLGRSEGDGFLKIKQISFRNGTIEADIKGNNTPQQSFVGIAFHGKDDETYDVVYFRPFNFRNPDRKSHSVQYIAHPTYTWQKLREENPGKYESALNSDLDPDDWFHVRIEINSPVVKVYIGDDPTPTLSVNQLSSGEGGWVGLWVGNFSDGWFRNLNVVSDE